VNFGMVRVLNPDPLARCPPVAFSPFAAKFVTIWPLRQVAFLFVMAGLVPAIHVLRTVGQKQTWMPGIKPGMTCR